MNKSVKSYIYKGKSKLNIYYKIDLEKLQIAFVKDN